jgi:protein-disulfide isomerase
MFRKVLALLLLCLVSPAAVGAVPDTAAVLVEQSLGRSDAPVTMIEYSSLTCPHCADFHRDTLPKLKAQYIDSGQMRYVYRDFPTSPLALGAGTIAHCVEPSRYFGFLDLLYADQKAWATSQNPLAELKIRAQLAGLSSGQVDECLKNEALLRAIQQRQEAGTQQYKIDSTPTFIINGQVVSGARPLSEFQKVIDAALAQTR